jgi:hypothetical protein
MRIVKVSEEMEGGKLQNPGQTRREFVRKLVWSSVYAAPAVLTFTAGGAFGGEASGIGMMQMMSPPGMGMMMGSPGDFWKKTPPKGKPKDK